MLTRLFRLLLNLFSLLAWAVRSAVYLLFVRRRAGGRRTWVRIRVPRHSSLRPPRGLVAALRSGDPSVDRLAWGRSVARIARDPAVAGLVLDTRKFRGGLAAAEVVGRQLDRARSDAGAHGQRPALALVDDALDLPRLWLGADACYRAISPPGGAELVGMRVEMTFLRGLLERAGVQAAFVHIGPWKSAAHRFIRRGPTRAQLEDLGRLLDDRVATVTDALARGPAGVSEETWLDAGWLDPGAARARGLVHGVHYDDQLEPRLAAHIARIDGDEPVALEVAEKRKLTVVNAGKWRGPPHLKWRPLRRRPVIAVVDMSGVIVMGGEGASMPGQRQLAWRDLEKTLERVRKDKRVRAVVFHIDSPGGSALASDLIWHAGRRIADKKPLIAAMGSVAASGGYYAAACCEHVVALENTITGSIGVVAGRFSYGELLAKLSIGHAAVARGRWSSLRSGTVPLDRDAHRALRRTARAIYRRFVARVAEGREMSRVEVHGLAQGRIYSGRRALDAGLVDEIGDLEDAVRVACERADVKRERCDVVVYPKAPGGLRGLLGRTRTTVQGAADGRAERLVTAALGLSPAALGHALQVAELMAAETALTVLPYWVEEASV